MNDLSLTTFKNINAELTKSQMVNMKYMFLNCTSLTMVPRNLLTTRLTIDTELRDSNIYYNIESLNNYSKVK